MDLIALFPPEMQPWKGQLSFLQLGLDVVEVSSTEECLRLAAEEGPKLVVVAENLGVAWEIIPKSKDFPTGAICGQYTPFYELRTALDNLGLQQVPLCMAIPEGSSLRSRVAELVGLPRFCFDDPLSLASALEMQQSLGF